MPELPREFPHLYLHGRAQSESYTSKLSPPHKKLPQRERIAHAEALRVALTEAAAAATLARQNRDPNVAEGTPGFYLDFHLSADSQEAAEALGNRPKDIELVAVRQVDPSLPSRATVFVPDAVADYFLTKIEAFRSENTPKGHPKNESLITRIETVALAEVRSLFTDDPSLFPQAGEKIWWEVWVRHGHAEGFDVVIARLEIPAQEQQLTFPDRTVRLIFGDEITIARIMLNSDAIAELKRAKDTPAAFLQLSNLDQGAWATQLVARIALPEKQDVAVCILDTGVTQVHPLIAPVLTPSDVQSYDPGWLVGDFNGHGTNMAGAAAYGDLMPALTGNGGVQLTHCLESVKIIPDQGENEPKLYGAITKECVARAEVEAPERRRAVCMAITSPTGTNQGRPSSWSAAVDQLCFGDETTRRLVLVSAGNIRDTLTKDGYPDRNDTEAIENPGQAWNAITVGAYTEKSTIADSTFAGWQPVAPPGEISPSSRTSLTWERQWPIKPDILLEGGNWAALNDQCDCPDDLGVLTTYRDPSIRHFDVFRDTSAATALAGNLTGRVLAHVPERWPETIRALLIHSAGWTEPMRQRFAAATSGQQRRALFRRYGYGVPSYDRAVFSAANDLTLIAEDELQPFWKDPKTGTIKTRHMNMHALPWPRTELEQLGAMEVELRVTLSYFIEPNPGERGWLRRHRYPSHNLRFAVKRPLESTDAFRARINKAAVAEEESLGTMESGSDGWFLGRMRNVGSIHSDYWRGTAADLSRRSAVGVYPIGGWWKENPSHHRYERKVRYALIVSVRAVNGSIDIYTPVRLQIAAAVEIQT